ncbi:hypothetical protein KVR01_009556 [Diaporthe batatas]|uniref:uncharacterized protein n=1 Tax=Diaporthe batatas TaxID=748121 RepID=UPI001D049FC5|nr:uncharacterized protein KVR01_009556 [Diaporthe batatas]KAG8161292.1 hypothetical protein KVR01_009556 [Diaporthe batatas]
MVKGSLRPARSQNLKERTRSRSNIPITPREGHSRWTKAEREYLVSERMKDPPTPWDDIVRVGHFFSFSSHLLGETSLPPVSGIQRLGKRFKVDGYVRHNVSNCQEAWEKHIRDSQPVRSSPRLNRLKEKVDKAKSESVEAKPEPVEDEPKPVKDGTDPVKLVKESESPKKGKRAVEEDDDGDSEPASPAKKARSVSKSKAV